MREGKAILNIETPKKVSSELDVFYNPVMEFNRTMSVLLLKSVADKKISVGLPMCASGVRGIRFLKELPASKVEHVYFNDNDSKAIKNVKENLKLNKIKKEKY